MNIFIKAFIYLAPLVVASATAAQDYGRFYVNTPVELKQVEAPSFPDLTVDLRDYGAKGDGVTLCTSAFEQAISFLNKKGGGHLIVPAGVWLTGPIALKNNIDLHVEMGAIVILSPDKSLAVKEGSERCNPGISASKRTNIAITGHGIIDGNGKYWRPVKKSKVSDVEWKEFKALGGTETDGGKLWMPYNLKHFDNQTTNPKDEEAIRADLVRFTDCTNVLVKDVTIQNSPRFHLHPVRCSNVIIDNVTVRCPWNAQNGDAIDLSNCRQALIVNSIVDAGDDGLCMKSGTAQKGVEDGPCEDILIQDCKVFHAHGGFVIGSDCAGGMKNIVVRNCLFSGTDTGLRFKSAPNRGGKTENIFISNIAMNDIKDAAITFSCSYEDKKYAVNNNDDKSIAKKAPFSPEFTDIHIDNVVCRESSIALFAEGMDDFDAIYDIDITNSTFFFTKKDKDIYGAKINLKDVHFVTFDK
ncbi:MAG: glycoside hydrolase family 28 protein [Bacteroidales bacterium]|nr:glycoside hydrolase family 28 protein [Bacteroidales bacterium]